MIVSYTPAIGSSSTVIALRKRRAEGSDGESAGEGEGQEKKEKEKNSLSVYSSELEYLTGWEWFLAIRQ